MGIEKRTGEESPSGTSVDIHELIAGGRSVADAIGNPAERARLTGGDYVNAAVSIKLLADAAEKAEIDRGSAVRETHARELHHFEEEQKCAALAAERDRLRQIIAEARAVTAACSVPLGVTEAHHFDRLLAKVRRILSRATEKGTEA